MTNTLLIEIAVGVAGPLLVAAIGAVNPRLFKNLNSYLPGINKYSGMAKLVLPMIDPKLAEKTDLMDAVITSLQNIARGEVSVPGTMQWAKQAAALTLDKESELQKFITALDEEFKVTEFNKVNASGFGNEGGI